MVPELESIVTSATWSADGDLIMETRSARFRFPKAWPDEVDGWELVGPGPSGQRLVAAGNGGALWVGETTPGPTTRAEPLEHRQQQDRKKGRLYHAFASAFGRPRL
jgi:hypothetical protein